MNLPLTALVSHSLALLIALGPVALAQPTIEARIPVSDPDFARPTNETAVAAIGSKLVAMWNVRKPLNNDFVPFRVGYAVSDDGGETWTDMGYFPLPDGCTGAQFDPTVVGDPVSDAFLGACVNNCGVFAAQVAVTTTPGATPYTNLELDHPRIAFAFPNEKQYGHYIGGNLFVRHNVQTAADPGNPDVLYVVYNDFVTAPENPNDDGDVDVYLIRGEYNHENEEWEWSGRIRINDDDPDVQHDQFFPTIAVDEIGDLHVAWFDTRNDPQDPGQDVAIPLYYAISTGGGQSFTNYEVDEVAIDTTELWDSVFIGDYIRMTVCDDAVVIVYNATDWIPSPSFPLLRGEVIMAARIVH